MNVYVYIHMNIVYIHMYTYTDAYTYSGILTNYICVFLLVVHHMSLHIYTTWVLWICLKNHLPFQSFSTSTVNHAITPTLRLPWPRSYLR